MAVAVVIPAPYAARRPSAATYARRRLVVLVVLAIVLVLLIGTGHVVANRGGAPASASAIRPGSQAAQGVADVAPVYIVQPGDTLWSIGERFHGSTPLADYVDRLVAANGGTTLQLAQPIPLP